MKKALITLAIIVAIVIVVGGITFALAPQGLVDFFMALGAEINIDFDGERYNIKFPRLEKGLETSDRLFVLKKAVAFAVRTDSNMDKAEDEYVEAVIKAADDELLTREEFQYLKNLHSDIMPEDLVNNWFVDLLGNYRNWD